MSTLSKTIKTLIETNSKELQSIYGTLRGSDLYFGEKTIFLEEMMDEVEVYLLEDGLANVAIQWNAGKKLISEILVGASGSVKQLVEEGSDTRKNILSALILLDAAINISGLNLSAIDVKEDKPYMVKEVLDDETAETLAEVINTGALNVSIISTDEFEIQSRPTDVQHFEGFLEIIVGKEETFEAFLEDINAEKIEEITSEPLSAVDTTLSKEEVDTEKVVALTVSTEMTEPVVQAEIFGEQYQLNMFETNPLAESESSSMGTKITDTTIPTQPTLLESTVVPTSEKKPSAQVPAMPSTTKVVEAVSFEHSSMNDIEYQLQKQIFEFEMKKAMEQISSGQFEVKELEVLVNGLAKNPVAVESMNSVNALKAFIVRLKGGEETILAEKKKVLTLDEVKRKRPYVFDDEKITSKLKALGVKPDIINYTVQFRKLQRDTLSLEQLMEVPNRLVYEGNPRVIEKALGSLLTGCNLMLTGIASTGKTTMTKTILTMLNMPTTFVGGSVETSMETLVGFKDLKNGSISVKNAPLANAIKLGMAFYLDEGNAVLPEILINLHSVLDEEKVFYNELTGEHMEAHPNFRFITTINKGYAGTNEFNPATLSRTVAIELDYISEDALENLLKTYDGNYSEFQKNVLDMDTTSKSDIRILMEINRQLKIAYDSDENYLPEEVLSIRNLTQLMRLTKVLPFDVAIEMIVDKMNDEEKSAIYAALQSIGVLKISATRIDE